MWAVYFCGCTDCFMAALFMSEECAREYAVKESNNPEGFIIKFVKSPADIDMSDTGWNQ